MLDCKCNYCYLWSFWWNVGKMFGWEWCVAREEHVAMAVDLISSWVFENLKSWSDNKKWQNYCKVAMMAKCLVGSDVWQGRRDLGRWQLTREGGWGPPSTNTWGSISCHCRPVTAPSTYLVEPALLWFIPWVSVGLFTLPKLKTEAGEPPLGDQYAATGWQVT